MSEIFHYSSKVENMSPLAASERELLSELTGRVQKLAGEIGERNLRHSVGLMRTIAYIEDTWNQSGFEVHNQDYFVDADLFTNLWVEIPGQGTPEKILVVGAHYDTADGTPGADDNGTAVAALLSLAIRARQWKLDKTVRFVAFANEEPPYFMTPNMGSHTYARMCSEAGDKIEGMVCFEMLGYYSDKEGSQKNIHGMLPTVGNFIGLVGDTNSRPLIEKAAKAFESEVSFPMEAAAVPLEMAPMAAFSDHWSFWQFGWPAFMLTDTGPLRNPNYHAPEDLPDTIDYDRFTRVVLGAAGVIRALAN